MMTKKIFVMPREGGASSSQRHLRLSRSVPAYWIVRRSLSSGRPKADRMADDDTKFEHSSEEETHERAF